LKKEIIIIKKRFDNYEWHRAVISIRIKNEIVFWKIKQKRSDFVIKRNENLKKEKKMLEPLCL
jgi:hypothetical protein